MHRLIAIAPATFGSPLAQEGRSPIGAIFKGKKILGPDFMAAGDLVLDALELGSRFTWDLTHRDILAAEPYYGLDSKTPYVFIFDGTGGYPGMTGMLANKPGTDGCVRWAGCSLNTEKFTVDFRRTRPVEDGVARWTVTNAEDDGRLPMPFYPVAGLNHGTIVSDPPDSLVDLVFGALQVQSGAGYHAWQQTADAASASEYQRLCATGQEWQQFVVHARDQHGEPIPDFHIEIAPLIQGLELETLWTENDLDVHPYSTDSSYRCYHVNVGRVREFVKVENITHFRFRVIASSGSSWVDYHGEGSEVLPAGAKEVNPEGKWDAVIDLPATFDNGVHFFYPFTTTLIEIVLERDAVPFGQVEPKLVTFLREQAGALEA